MLNHKLNSFIKTSKRIKLLIVLITVLIICFFIPSGESLESEVKVGTVWIQDDLIASRTFEVLKDPSQYEKEKKLAESKVLPVFLRNLVFEEIMIDSISRYNKFILENIYSNSIINKTFLNDASFQILLKYKSKKNFLINILELSKNILKDIYDKGILDVTKEELKKDSIQLRTKNIQKVFPFNSFIPKDKIEEYLSYKIKSEIIGSTETENVLREYIIHFVKPNIIYSLGLTEESKNLAKQKISRNVGIVNENERIISKHDRVTPDVKLKIDSYKIAKGEEKSFILKLLQYLGIYLHIMLIVLPLVIYIYLFRKKIYIDNSKILLISFNFILISSIAYIINTIKTNFPIEYIIIVPVSSMLLTIIFDSRVGFYSNVALSLIIGALRGNDYTFAVANIVTGGLAAYTVRDIKNRTQIFRSFVYILVGYSLSIISFGFESYQQFSEIFYSLSFAAANALISPIITYGLIIFFEKLFNITTDLTLLELTDLNRPLLKDLAKNAPGTFSHSIAMGTMAETTAEAINANPILARVGAYYHDIGKIIQPEVFVENQIDTHNIHENLPPEKSRDIILNHVEKGIELARKNKLPEEIIKFIPMHHGTMVLTYFYEKAKKLYGESNVNIDEYRYLGPKPNTKETAIVMLADACESTIRTIEESDPQIIENVINNLINSRIDDGQLDEAPLTFNDIKKIKESFYNILIGHHHRRIRYPNQDELETKSEE